MASPPARRSRSAPAAATRRRGLRTSLPRSIRSSVSRDCSSGRAGTCSRCASPTCAWRTAPTPRTLVEDQYEVKRGDTLYSIALEHGVAYRDLAQWNSLDDPSKIRVGQVLRVKPEEPRDAPVGRGVIVGRVEPRPLESRPLDAPPAAPSKPKPAAPPADPDALKFVWPAKGKLLAAFEQT